MLDQIARHGALDLTVKAKGDLEIDAHHTVEDIGITLGMAVARALADRRASAATGTPTSAGRGAFPRGGRLLGPPGLEFHVDFTAPAWASSTST